MDTDDLTQKAYGVLIGESGQISDCLRAEIGASAADYPNEDAYLRAMHSSLECIADSAAEYLESWDLLDEIDPVYFRRQVRELADRVMSVLVEPKRERGPTEW